MHSHFSALTAFQTFLAVLAVGTVWRLASLHLMASGNPHARTAGQAMAFQY